MNRIAYKMLVGASLLGLTGLIMVTTGPARAAVHPTPAASPPGRQTLPAALRPTLYQALAKDAGSAYRINGNGCATLPKPSLKACFDDRGVRFNGTDTAPLALRLLAYGRQAHLRPISATHPRIAGNRVDYVHGNLTEWWRVLPVGFEQGFTIAKRPGGHGELTLALTMSRQDAGAPSTRHSRESGNPVKARVHENMLAWGKLRYGKLVVTDAHGKVVPATLKTKGNRILIAVNDAHAAYPLTVDPLVWLEQKVTASDGVAGDEFGVSVMLNSDGTTALVGAEGKNDFQGAAYVFSESGGTWTQAGELTAADGATGDDFGFSVALDSDGTTALVGADGKNDSQGAAYVFSESGGTWAQTQELTAADGADNSYFGWKVALDSDGTTALVGAVQATVNGQQYQGAAYVFSESGGTWAQTQELTAADGVASDYFGRSVALGPAGTTALVGAVGKEFFQGAAYVFSESGGTWTQTQELTAADGAEGDYFGRSVALGSAGTTALVGAIGKKFFQGAVYVFSESGGTWTQTQELTAADGAASDYFGVSAALDSDGTTALVGADGKIDFQGAAYFYGKSDLGLSLSAPQTVGQGQQYTSQTIATNSASAASPAVNATIAVPAAASFVSATASQGSCSQASGVVTCDFGQIDGNAGMATANVTLKATGNVGDTIDNTASIAHATPPLSASAATTITEGGACPDGYTEYDGSLNPGEVARSPVYQAPGGSENAILTAPESFQLYVVYQSGRFGRHVYRVPGNEVHRWAPKGLYMWLVRAHDGAGAYTLCLQHP